MRMILAGLTLLLALGCGGGLGIGGSGSSGFDEAFVISSALEEGECQNAEGVFYCPTNVADPGGGGQTVDAALPDTEEVDCTEAGALASVSSEEAGTVVVDGKVLTEACGFEVPVVTEGFQDDVQIRIAVKVTGGDEKWQISDEVYEADTDFTAEVDVEAPDDATEFDVQVAILTFEPGAAKPPAEVGSLTESGATSAYVTPEVRVVTEPEPTPGESVTPTPTPTATPDAATPTPDAATPTPDAATPTPDGRTVTPTPDDPIATATPDDRTATPTPDDRLATPTPDRDKPTPDRDKPTPTPNWPDVVDPTDPTDPGDGQTPTPEPTLTPTRTSEGPDKGDGTIGTGNDRGGAGLTGG